MSARFGRRAFLGGAAVAIGLPLLESLGPRKAAHAGGAPPTRRMLVFYVPNGAPEAAWTPATTGRDFALSPILSPLADLRSEVLVLSGLANRPAERVFRGDDAGAGDHARGTGSFLTCARIRRTAGADLRSGVSADQVAAQAVGAATRFPSLQLAAAGGSVVGDCDAGYSCAYTANISWASPTRPLARLTSPLATFNRMFGGFDLRGTREEQARRRVYSTSVLDLVAADASRLSGRLGASDRARLDEYLTSVREVERRVADATPLPAGCAVPDAPPSGVSFASDVDRMCELMALAFQCDLTRVISFMIDNSGGNHRYDFVGARGGHHELSHHQGDPDKIRQLVAISTWQVERFASLARRLRDLRGPDGTSLLDETTALFSSEISDGNAHTHDRLPVLLAGRCGGQFDTGRHVAYASERPLANLYVSQLRAVGARVDRFGDDGDGALEDLGPVSA